MFSAWFDSATYMLLNIQCDKGFQRVLELCHFTIFTLLRCVFGFKIRIKLWINFPRVCVCSCFEHLHYQLEDFVNYLKDKGHITYVHS